MERKGASQIDWIMSLALFLMYVAWFFLYMTPSISFNSNRDSMMVLLETKFEDEFEWSIKRYPLFIEHNETGSYKPVIMEYPYNTTDFIFEDGNEFIVWNDRLLFLRNISSSRQYTWILEGGNYSHTLSSTGLNVEETWASSENISVAFDDSLPESISYFDEEKVIDIGYTINSVSLIPDVSSYNDSGFAAIYHMESGNINHTTMIFGYNPDVYNFLTFEDQESNYTFDIDMDLVDFDSYYADNAVFGDFDYQNFSQEVNFTHDRIILYSGNSKFAILFDRDAEFLLTYYNRTLKAEISVVVSSPFSYQYHFGTDNLEDIRRTLHFAEFGSVETISGIFMENITSNYSYYKAKWKFPNSMDFVIRIYDNSTAQSYDDYPVKQIGYYTSNPINVYSESRDMYAMDKYGGYTPMSVNFRVW